MAHALENKPPIFIIDMEYPFDSENVPAPGPYQLRSTKKLVSGCLQFRSRRSLSSAPTDDVREEYRRVFWIDG